ncbi:Pepsin II-4, partial [Durusdinium trenchii]
MWAGRMVTAPHPLLLPTGHFPMGGNASCEALLPPPGLGLQPGCRPGEKIRRCIHKRSRNPSPAKQVRDATRQMLFLTRTAPGKDAKPAAESNERIGSVLASAVDSVLLGMRGVLHEAFLGCAGPIAGRMARCRNLFPLPLLTSWPDSIEVEPLIVDAALLLANVGIVSLNFLRCDFKISRLKGAARGPATAAQQEACNHIARRGRDMQPSVHMPEFLQTAVQHPRAIFPEQATCLARSPLDPLSTKEYLRLVVRELACGKLRLRRQVAASAAVFAARKTAPGRQRKIWNGSQLSELAARPPKPERLADPSTFLDIVSEVNSGWTLDILCTFVDDLGGSRLTEDMMLHPAHAVWPMGFSWSSAVAQSVTLSVATTAGVSRDNILCADCPPPQDQSELCWVATDDTVFAHRDLSLGKRTLEQFDAAMAESCIPRKTSKDVTLTEHVTALGCDLSSRPHMAEPAAAKLAACFCSLLDRLNRGMAAPKAANGLLGVLQWFCLLQRPAFSVFDNIYEFARRQPQHIPQELPKLVMVELAVACGLLPLLAVSLDRPYHEELLACDAAPEFGFGVCAAPCSQDILHRLGCLAERRGDFVRLYREDGDEPEVPRLGTPHRLNMPKHSFKTVVSSRAKWGAHSGVLEAHGLLLVLKWVGRNWRKHHKRLVVLVDAKAVLGAAAKGRSSAPALRGVIRAIADLCESAGPSGKG